MEDWSARQYLKFEDERTRPVRDLLAAIPYTDVSTAADLGCGPGNSTEAVMARFPQATVVGVDNSPDMIAAARERLPGVIFEHGDLVDWTPAAPLDLVFSNATLQWVARHETVFPHLLKLLAPGGSLAVQMPSNGKEPCHEAMWRIAEGRPWGDRIMSARGGRTRVDPPDFYYALLRPLCARLDIWLTVYQHPLAGTEAVVEWFKSTGLRPYLAALDEDERADYLDRYREALDKAYPIQPDGTLLLPFPRLFIVATL